MYDLNTKIHILKCASGIKTADFDDQRDALAGLAMGAGLVLGGKGLRNAIGHGSKARYLGHALTGLGGLTLGSSVLGMSGGFGKTRDYMSSVLQKGFNQIPLGLGNVASLGGYVPLGLGALGAGALGILPSVGLAMRAANARKLRLATNHLMKAVTDAGGLGEGSQIWKQVAKMTGRDISSAMDAYKQLGGIDQTTEALAHVLRRYGAQEAFDASHYGKLGRIGKKLGINPASDMLDDVAGRPAWKIDYTRNIARNILQDSPEALAIQGKQLGYTGRGEGWDNLLSYARQFGHLRDNAAPAPSNPMLPVMGALVAPSAISSISDLIHGRRD